MTQADRDLIQRLADALEAWRFSYGSTAADRCIIQAARTYLAQPEPGAVTDEELLRTYGLAKRDHCYEGPIDDWPRRAERAATVTGLRAVLARYGNPLTKPEVGLPPRPPLQPPAGRSDLVRYGVTWDGSPDKPLLTPTPDGYWTPWHIAAQTLPEPITPRLDPDEVMDEELWQEVGE